MLSMHRVMMYYLVALVGLSWGRTEEADLLVDNVTCTQGLALRNDFEPNATQGLALRSFNHAAFFYFLCGNCAPLYLAEVCHIDRSFDVGETQAGPVSPSPHRSLLT